MFKYRGIIGFDIFPSRDFNDYTSNGWYMCNGTNTEGFTNYPHPADNGILIVFGIHPRQIFIGGYSGSLRTRWLSESDT